jgi:perosamine synthetase
MSDNFIPISKPLIGPREKELVLDALESGWVSSIGKYIDEFEEKFARYCGTAYALAVSNGTTGLHLALATLGLGAGDEVIVPDLTFVATANAVAYTGATPVLADIDADTLCLDPASVKSLISPRTKAIIPVHLYGHPCEMDALNEIADAHGVAVIEDAAEAHGAEYKGRRVGGLGKCGVFSFYGNKVITTGEGGMLTTDDAALAERVRLLRFHGIARDAWSRYGKPAVADYEVVELGFKYNMTDMQAALGLVQLGRLEEFLTARARVATWYAEALANLPGVEMLSRVPYPARHAWHLLVIRLQPGDAAADRDTLMQELSARNIGVGLHFKALHLHRFYRERAAQPAAELPHATRASRSIFSLPLFPAMTPDDVHDVVDALTQVLSARAA